MRSPNITSIKRPSINAKPRTLARNKIPSGTPIKASNNKPADRLNPVTAQVK